MQVQELLKERKQRGYEIAKKGKVILQGNNWLVPSSSTKGMYKVELKIDQSTCTCPDFQKRGIKCKHIFAVEITVEKRIDAQGNAVIIETKRITYPQNWVAYDKAQTEQKDLFMKLLYDVCQLIPEEQRPITKGRPRMSIRDMAFVSALKVFTTFSLRRFTTDSKKAQELGYVSQVPHYSTVALYIEDPKLTLILRELIRISSMPLRTIETDFAIDSTGFRTTKFNDYCREKHHMEKKHKWIKAHLCCGVKTNIITAVEIGNEHDTLQFIPLATQTYDNGFVIKEVSGDKAYSSKANYNAINELGGTAYIPFKSNTKVWGSSHSRANSWSNTQSKGDKARIWRKMYRYFTYNQEEFLEHYHKRSNIESTNNMIKSKFTDLIRSKTETAQNNEVLLKVLCHNICVVIQEMFELGIEPNFIE